MRDGVVYRRYHDLLFASLVVEGQEAERKVFGIKPVKGELLNRRRNSKLEY